MAIAFVQSKGAASVGAGTTATVTLDATPTDGNVLVMWCVTTGNVIPGLPSGWTEVDAGLSTGSSPRGIRGGYKFVAGDSATVSLTLGSTNWILIVVELSGASTFTGGATQLNASGTNTTPSVTPTTGYATWAVFVNNVKTTATWSLEACSGTNVGTVTERQDIQNAAVATAAAVSTAPISSTTGAYQGSGTPSAAGVGAGGIAFFAARPSLLYNPAPPMIKSL